jgi:hypothetical protein
MSGSATAQRQAGLPAEITRSIASLWTRYARHPPSGARTEIRGKVVTCVLLDAVGEPDRTMSSSPKRATVGGLGDLAHATYSREAVEAVEETTSQRVASFVSSHDSETNVLTEVFTLEASLGRPAPWLADRRSRRFSADARAPPQQRPEPG